MWHHFYANSYPIPKMVFFRMEIAINGQNALNISIIPVSGSLFAWTPRDLPRAKAVMQYNLSTAHAIRGEFEKALMHLVKVNRFYAHCQISNIRHTKSQHRNVFRLILQLSLPHPLEQGVMSRMKMWLEQRRQAMLQLHLSDQQFYCLLRCSLY